MFRKLFSRKEVALTGAPPVRRLKTYSAQSGYVYQYYYEGQRPIAAAESGTEFVFTISPDRKSWHTTRVLLPDAVVGGWEAANARQLSATERYAIAKMSLFQAFDDREVPAAMKDDVRVDAAAVETIVANLDL